MMETGAQNKATKKKKSFWHPQGTKSVNSVLMKGDSVTHSWLRGDTGRVRMKLVRVKKHPQTFEGGKTSAQSQVRNQLLCMEQRFRHCTALDIRYFHGSGLHSYMCMCAGINNSSATPAAGRAYSVMKTDVEESRPSQKKRSGLMQGWTDLSQIHR